MNYLQKRQTACEGCNSRNFAAWVRPSWGMVIIALSSAGCAEWPYRFAKAFGSNYSFKYKHDREGNYDVKRLIGDKRDKGEELREQLVVPLIYVRRKIFDDESAASDCFTSSAESSLTPGKFQFSDGYLLDESLKLGPLGIICMSAGESHYDSAGARYEKRERLSVLWRLYAQQRTTILTPYGAREEIRYSLLFGLLPFYQEIIYPEQSLKPEQPPSPGNIETEPKPSTW